MTFSTGDRTPLGVLLLACALVLSAAGGAVATPGASPEADAGAVQPSSHTGLTVSPSTITFPATKVGESRTTTITIRNDSPNPITASSVRIAGDTEAFAVIDPIRVEESRDFGDSELIIPPGFSQDVTVQFAPRTTGDHAVSVRIANEDGNTIASVSASGTGVAGPDVTASPQSVSFREVSVGETRSETVAVTNEGDVPLRVTETRLRGDTDYDVASPAPFDLAPGASEEVTVTFTPTTTASQTDLLEVRTNDSDQPVLPVSLSSSDTRREVTATDTDGQRTVDVTVRNATAGERVDVPVPSAAAGDNVDIERISVTPERDGDFSLNVTDSSEPLATTPDLETGDNAAGLQYLNVTTSVPNDDIAEVRYRYRISKDRVANMTVSPDSLNGTRVGSDAVAGAEAITMYRYVDGQWQEEETRVVDETATHYEFLTTGDGFSEWTAAAKRPNIQIADADARVEAAAVGGEVLIQVQLTNDGGADGVFETELLFNDTVVDQRDVTVPNGSTVPVSFTEAFEEPRVYQVTVNDVPVADIAVTEGEAAVDDPDGDRSDDDGGGDSDSSEDGVLATQPVTVGAGVLILLGIVGGLLYVRRESETDEPVSVPSGADEEVVHVEGFEEETGGIDAGTVPGEDSPEDATDGDTGGDGPP